ncbi:MAG: Flp pilus assembly protein CpaB [Gaiellaceae bacterium]
MQNVFSGRLTTTRGGAAVLGTAAAILAGLLLLLYLNHYRNSVNANAKDAPVLVAKSLIPRGTPGALIAQKGLFTTQALAHSAVKAGAIVDPAYLSGRVTTSDIYPGQQLTVADISVGVTDALPSQISGRQRAFALSVDGARGLVGFVNNGDHVDIYYETAAAGTTDLALLAANVTILRAPAKDQPTVIGADAVLAQKLALAVDTGTLWFLLRPAAQAHEAPKKLLTSQQLLSLIQSER